MLCCRYCYNTRCLCFLNRLIFSSEFHIFLSARNKFYFVKYLGDHVWLIPAKLCAHLSPFLLCILWEMSSLQVYQSCWHSCLSLCNSYLLTIICCEWTFSFCVLWRNADMLSCAWVLLSQCYIQCCSIPLSLVWVAI